MFNGNFTAIESNGSEVQRYAARSKAKGTPANSAAPVTYSPTRTRARLRAANARGGEARFQDLAPVPAADPGSVKAEAETVSFLRADSASDSILSIYVREAGATELLTLADESELAARIKAGDAAARERMIRSNLRLVIKIAREYEHLGMPLLDLINEGNIGLMRAVEKFDPAKGSKLSSYASLWIRQQIRRALASQGKTIRLPIHIADKIYQLGQAEARMRHLLGREATDEELAHELGVKVSKLSRLRRAAMRPASLDAPLNGENDATVAEVVADDNVATPFEALRDKTETRLIRQLVEKLPEREANIIRFRFGLDGSNERTLEEVGRLLNLTRERIRQLQNLAFAKLRQMLEEPGVMPVAA